MFLCFFLFQFQRTRIGEASIILDRSKQGEDSALFDDSVMVEDEEEGYEEAAGVSGEEEKGKGKGKGRVKSDVFGSLSDEFYNLSVAWQNEKNAPDILKCEFELVQVLKAAIQAQEDMLFEWNERLTEQCADPSLVNILFILLLSLLL